jgi:hypothetical protein
MHALRHAINIETKTRTTREYETHEMIEMKAPVTRKDEMHEVIARKSPVAREDEIIEIVERKSPTTRDEIIERKSPTARDEIIEKKSPAAREDEMYEMCMVVLFARSGMTLALVCARTVSRRCVFVGLRIRRMQAR